MTSSPPAFGRAKPPNRPPLPAKRRAPAPQPMPAAASDDVAQDLAAWKQSRQRLPFPWRQFLLVMGLCLAGASLVLPADVNDAATYVLYALAAISFFSGLARRRKNPS